MLCMQLHGADAVAVACILVLLANTNHLIEAAYQARKTMVEVGLGRTPVVSLPGSAW